MLGHFEDCSQKSSPMSSGLKLPASSFPRVLIRTWLAHSKAFEAVILMGSAIFRGDVLSSSSAAIILMGRAVFRGDVLSCSSTAKPVFKETPVSKGPPLG